MKKVIYTCLTGDYDNLIEHQYINPDWDYVCFTDNLSLKERKNSVWEIRPLCFDEMDDVRNQRWHKINPHIIFSQYTESLYIDTNIDILNSDIFDDIEKVKKQKSLMSIGIHFERKNLYDEFEVCLKLGKDKKDIILKQQELIKESGFSGENGPFFENNIIYRKHNDEKVIKIMSDWWWWVKNYSRRDQLSLFYVLWKNNFNMIPLSNITYRKKSGVKFIPFENHITKEELLVIRDDMGAQSFLLVSTLKDITDELNLSKLNYDYKVNELSEIYKSKSWKVLSIYRKFIGQFKIPTIFYGKLNIYRKTKSIFIMLNIFIRKILKNFNSVGFKKIINKIKNTVLKNKSNNMVSGDKFLNRFYFIDYYDKKNVFQPKKIDINKKLIINWIIPDFGIGSGGHSTIFKIIHHLEKMGHKNRIYIFDCGLERRHYDGKIAKQEICDNFIKIDAEVYTNTDNIKDSDIIFATSWQTAYFVYPIKNTKQKFYFVQDFEPMFYPAGAESLFAEQTYKMGFKCICGGSWLSRIMKEKYNALADHFWLAYESNIYKTDKRIKRKENKIIFYGRNITSRRAFEFGILTLKEVKKAMPDIEIEIFGWDLKNEYIPFEYKNSGILSSKELSRLYCESTIGIVFSATNYSITPQEMMACKLPVVEISSDSTKDIFLDGKNVLLVDPIPNEAAKKIIELIKNSENRNKLSENAYKWVCDFSWEKSAKMVENAMYNL